jgi:hypothetical protein
MRNLLNETGIAVSEAVPILCDNQGTVFTANNPYQNQSSKHLDIRYFRVRQYIKEELIDVLHVSGEDNLADFFTKSLTPVHFYRFKHLLMNTDEELCNVWRKAGQAQSAKLLAEKIRAAESAGSIDDTADSN